jgi:DNA-binding CsgD family transcriptional regulator
VAPLCVDIPAVETALETFRRLGARVATRRGRQRVAQLRGRDPDSRRKATIADPHGLTQRDAGRHVGSILSKLGVRNRTQAAAYAAIESPPAR